MIPCEVRPGTLQDLNALCALEQAVFIPSDGMLTRRAFRHYLRSQHLLLVAQRDAEVLAYVLVRLYRKRARAYSLAVAPAAQGQGIARQLMQAALVQIQDLGYTLMTLEVRCTNLAAQALYQSLGFAVCERRKDYYAPQEDGLAMALHLDKPQQ